MAAPFGHLDEPADAVPDAAATRAGRVGVRRAEALRGGDVAAAAAAELEAEATAATASSSTSGRGLLVAPDDGGPAGEGQSNLPAVEGGVAIDPPPPPLLLRPAPPRDILSLFLTVSPSAAGDGRTPPAAPPAEGPAAAAPAAPAALVAARADAGYFLRAATRTFPVEPARGGRERGAGVVAAPPREPAAPPALFGVFGRRVTAPGEGFLP